MPKDDPTGGAYTSPTLLFIPAGAMPAWNVRVTVLSEFQGPYQTAAAPNPDAGIRPGAGVELGLPAGFAVAAGTNWVGGDVNASGQKDFNLGLSPYVQARFHILGDRSGRDFQLGTSLTYKFVGFEGDPGEVEWALSAQYRRPSWEAGLQAVMGKDFATTDAPTPSSTPTRSTVWCPSSASALPGKCATGSSSSQVKRATTPSPAGS